MENPTSLFGIPHLVSWIVLTPFIGMVVVAFLRHAEIIRWTTLGVTLITLGLTAGLWASFDYRAGGMQFVDRVPFPGGFFDYAVGVDGISLPLVFLTTFIIPLCVLVSWRVDNTKAFMLLILLVELAVTGVFTAVDAFLFLLFWEAAMIPMYFVIAFWGGPKRVHAAIKFLLFSVGGSLLLSLGIEALHHFGGGTFDLLALRQVEYAPKVQFLIFVPLFLGFAIKVPMLPVHGWIADAHGEAPAVGHVILSGLLLKMGAYGLIRFCLAILPEASASFAPLIQWLSVLAILYGGILAMAQRAIKRFIAYSSVAHMGFITLGIFGLNQEAIQGAVFQMVSHGMTLGTLFLAAGMLYDRTHNPIINDYGGLHQVMPRFTALLTIFVMASIGLPGTGSFIGEFMILVGTSYHSYILVLLALIGIVVGAVYMLSLFQRLVLGPVTPYVSTLPDLTRREMAAVIPMAIVVLAIGLYPGIFLNLTHASVATLVQGFAQLQALRIEAVFTTP
jgi:NADH-quinone oxidoreductase subunit M